MGQCTDKQAKVLEKYGYDTDVDFDRASQIITAISDNGWKRPERLPPAGPQRGSAGTAQQQRRPESRRTEHGPKYPGPATAKQCAVLAKYNYITAGMTFAEASKLIDRLAANGWKRPDYDEDEDLGNDDFENDDDLDAEDLGGF